MCYVYEEDKSAIRVLYESTALRAKYFYSSIFYLSMLIKMFASFWTNQRTIHQIWWDSGLYKLIKESTL